MSSFGQVLDALPYVFGVFLSLGLLFWGYDTALHPLRKYPGPFIARFTDGYAGYHAIRKRGHRAMYDNHQKYGPVFRSGPNRLVFNTSGSVRDIYLNKDINKAGIYRVTQFHANKNIFGTLDRERHRSKRKVYAQVLSDRSLRRFEPTMIGEMNVFLRQLSKAGSAPVDLSPLCERLATDIAGQLGFGQPLNTQVDEANRIFPKAMISMNAVVSLFLSWPTIAAFWPVLKRLNKKNSNAFAKAVRETIKARVAEPKNARPDFYSVAASDENPEEAILLGSEIWAEAVFFLPAGGTTVAAAMSAMFFYLSRHRAVYDRLAAEIRCIFSSDGEIQSTVLFSRCKYLRAVIDETLRLSPPFLGTLWREPHESFAGPWIVDGHAIPPGTVVGVNPYALLHNARSFPEPFRFCPERWLEGGDADVEGANDPRTRTRMKEAFAPFAAGDTACLGKPMAYQELSLLVAKTIWAFDFRKAPGEAGRLGEGDPSRFGGPGGADEFQLFDLAVADHHGPTLVFEPRRAGLENDL
ncbi:cytochrome P450 [Xylariomycetidae sp. FL0641]|nr:cytochrome P450 [Xylariomycetidae sp. FL0641]